MGKEQQATNGIKILLVLFLQILQILQRKKLQVNLLQLNLTISLQQQQVLIAQLPITMQLLLILRVLVKQLLLI